MASIGHRGIMGYSIENGLCNEPIAALLYLGVLATEYAQSIQQPSSINKVATLTKYDSEFPCG